MAFEMEKDPGWQYLRLSREQMMKEQSQPFDSKKDVWVPDKEEGYVAGKVISTKGDQMTVSADGKELTIKKDSVHQMNPPKYEKTEDMSNLTILNDACVLHNLRARYKEMLIYTYSGLFCVVINPYKRLPIYTDSVAGFYIGKRRSEMPPHLFAVSDESYRNMLQDHENQSILITGESGAGKTENTKKVIAYFASVGASQTQTAAKTEEKKVTLEDQIVQTNPVLEAFGNARTVRNNNSSRFGKFIRIHFSKRGKVASCDIEHYLLEKSRVIRQAPGERCYHIFYQMYSDYKPELKPLLLLDRPLRDYWFVAQAELVVDGMNDAEEFQLTDEAFDILHFSEEEKMNCYRLMSAHMHLGNMKFKQRAREEQAEPEGTDEAEKAAKMYGVEVEDLLKAFTHPRVKVGTEWVNKGQNVDQVSWAVGAMGKAIYARVFNWLVGKCNETLDQKGISRDFFIGVLDIAGFEIFDFNSFEQLWINFVNEKLQQFFNHHMFVLEQEEYAREKIDWTFIDFGLDLQACIELIEKPMGIISMLDEECIVPKATDTTLGQKLIEQHLGKHPNFEKPKPPKGKQAEAHFAMRHYAGVVRYNVSNWLEKNKDPLNDTVAACLKASPVNALLNTIWEDYTTQEEASHIAKSAQVKKKGKSGSFMTVSMLYRTSLNNLMTMLYKTHPHFIRCIIPNEKKKSGLLDASLVLNQLTCNGVLEGIRICRKGFPNRTLHEDYVQRYAILGAEESKSGKDAKECATKMLLRLVNEKSMKEDMYRMGLTKVFFKAGVLAHLEDLRDEKLNYILSGLQAQIRYYFQLIEYKDRKDKFEAAMLIQRNAHVYVNAVTWEWFKLFIDTMPLVRESKVEETLEQLKVDVGDFDSKVSRKREEIDELKANLAKINAEKTALLAEIRNSRSGNIEVEEQIDKIATMNAELETVLSTARGKFDDEQKRTVNDKSELKKIETEIANLRNTMQNVELSKRKAESDKISLDNQIKALRAEILQQEEITMKINKEIKHQEEICKKLEDDISVEEEIGNQGDSATEKLKGLLQECEERFETEKRTRGDADKAKRKADGALKIATENSDELEKQKHDLENNLRKKDIEVHAAEVRFEDLEALAFRINKQNQEQDGRMQELEEAIESERQARLKTETMRINYQHELDDIFNHLQEQKKATGIQIETGKKSEAEIAKLRRELESAKIEQQSAIDAARKKNLDAAMALKEQIAELEKKKARAENNRTQLRQQLEMINNQLDAESKSQADDERNLKSAQAALSDLQVEVDEQTRLIDDLLNQQRHLFNENDQLKHQYDAASEQLNELMRLKAQFVAQIVEAEKTNTNEINEVQNLNSNIKNLQHEIDRLKDLLEDEMEEKGQLNRQLNKAEMELQQLKATFDDQGLTPSELVDDAKRKQLTRVQQLQEALDSANSRLTELEKTKLKLSMEADDASKEVDRRSDALAQLEKKQKILETEAGEWKRKIDDLNNTIDGAQRENRLVNAELYKERSQNESLVAEVEGIKRENKNIADEIVDLQHHYTDEEQLVHELQKTIHRLETDKSDLQHMLDEAEAALEAEEIKVTRTQTEIKQIRAEAEKRMQAKDEEFENAKRNVQRNLENVQTNTESEKKEKLELQKTCKKLQQDINELETALEHANEANTDAQKNTKRYAAQIAELQAAIDDEQRRREEARENYLNMEKSLSMAQGEKEEVMHRVQQLEKANFDAEREAADLKVQVQELEVQNSETISTKKKLDADLASLKSEISESNNELRSTEDTAKASAADAARLCEELRAIQEQSQRLELENKNIDLGIKEIQSKIDDVEGALIRGGQSAVQKLEQRIKTLNLELTNEKRRYQDAMKNLMKQERKMLEMQFQIDENKKKYSQDQDFCGKLQAKIKEQKKLIDEREEESNITLQKYKQLQAALEHVEERAQAAEEGLHAMRSRQITAK